MISLKPRYNDSNVTSANQTGWVVDLTILSWYQRENEICIELNDKQCRECVKIISWG